MFPLRDKQRSSIRPWVTILLVALNAGVFAYEVSLEPFELQRLVQNLGLTPARYADPRWRRELGLSLQDFWPFFTSMFLHGGLLHVVSNLWFLWVFGDNVEARCGRLRFLAFYLSCGIASGIVHVVVEPLSTAPTIGASGAIAAVMGAYFRLFPRGKVITVVPICIFPLLFELPAVLFLGIWFALQLLGASQGHLSGDPDQGVAFWAHIGGFVTGLISLPLFLKPQRT